MRGMLSAVASFNGPLVISPPSHLERHSVLPGTGGGKRQIANALSLTPSQDLLSWSPWFVVQDAVYSQHSLLL